MSLEHEMMEVVRYAERRLEDEIDKEDLDGGERLARTIRAQHQAISEGMKFLARHVEALEAGRQLEPAPNAPEVPQHPASFTPGWNLVPPASSGAPNVCGEPPLS
jgi:hypothetical protein